MKLRTTFLLLILNVAVFFFLFRQESPFDVKDQMGTEDLRILPIPMTEVTGIEVSGRAFDVPYQLRMKEEGWVIVDPIEWDANTFAVRRMLSALESADVSVRFPVSDIYARNQSLADFGLEDPNFQVTIAYGEERFVYTFGAPVEINDQLYMLGPSSDEILVVKSSMIEPFFVDMDALRSHRLFSIPVFEFRSVLVEFNDENSRRRFTNERGGWMIDSPFLANANDERVQGAIDRLVNYDVDLSTVRSANGDLQDVTHFNAIARFEIIGNRRNSTLLVSRYIVDGEFDSNLYLARKEGSNTTFLVPKTEIDWWRTSQLSLRERHFMDIDPGKVSKIEIVDAGDTPQMLQLLKLENKQWRVYAGSERVELLEFLGDGGVINDVLADLNDIIALAFASDQPTDDELEKFGLVTPRKTVTLELEETLQLLVGNRSEDGQQVYVRVQGSDSVYLVANEIIEGLSANALAFRKRAIALIPQSETVVGFKIIDTRNAHITDGLSPESLAESAIQSLSDEDTRALHAAICALLKDFRVSNFVDGTFENDSIKYGLIDIELPFELEVYVDANRSATTTLKLGKRLSGTEQLAWLPDQGLSVKLEQNLIDVLHPLIYATNVPEEWAPPESSKRIESVVLPESLDPSEAVADADEVVSEAESVSVRE